MSTNVTHVHAIRCALRISRASVESAEDLPESMGDQLERLTFGPDDYATLNQFWWCGESSGNGYYDGSLDAFIALTEGEADLVFVWEGGEDFTGGRIRNGEMTECDVTIGLGAER